jgi:hypothetical protein
MTKRIDGITKEQLMKCYHLAASIVSLYGDAYLPIFKRLHDEVEKIKCNENIKTLALTVASCNTVINKSEQS